MRLLLFFSFIPLSYFRVNLLRCSSLPRFRLIYVVSRAAPSALFVVVFAMRFTSPGSSSAAAPPVLGMTRADVRFCSIYWSPVGAPRAYPVTGQSCCQLPQSVARLASAPVRGVSCVLAIPPLSDRPCWPPRRAFVSPHAARLRLAVVPLSPSPSCPGLALPPPARLGAFLPGSCSPPSFFCVPPVLPLVCVTCRCVLAGVRPLRGLLSSALLRYSRLLRGAAPAPAPVPVPRHLLALHPQRLRPLAVATSACAPRLSAAPPATSARALRDTRLPSRPPVYTHPTNPPPPTLIHPTSSPPTHSQPLLPLAATPVSLI